jgi:hypothetical protein
MIMNDIELIYEKIKDEYDLILTNSLDLDDGFSWDVPVITGESGLGKFYLYADRNTKNPKGEQFVFSLAWQEKHWHPQTIDDAICDIRAFMSGRIEQI